MMNRTGSSAMLLQFYQIMCHHRPHDTNTDTAVNTERCTLQQHIKFIIVYFYITIFYKIHKMILMFMWPCMVICFLQ